MEIKSIFSVADSVSPFYLRSDFRQEAYLIYLQFKSRAEKHPNPQGYLIKTIKGRLKNLMIKEAKKDKKLKEKLVESENWKIEFEEIIDKFEDREKIIIKARCNGYKNREIAQVFKCTEQNIQRIIKKIERKWHDFS